MSDVVPSFFPTPHEIAGGIRWMREHPVVATAAAAAATAVSVLTYLKSRVDSDSDSDLADQHQQQQTCSKSAHAAQGHAPDECGPVRERFQTWSDSYELQSDDPVAAPSSRATTVKASRSHDTLASKLHHRAVDAASDDVYSSTESEVSTTSPTVRRSHPSSSSVNHFAFSGPDDDDADAVSTVTLSPSAAAQCNNNCGSSVPSSLRMGFPESVLEEDEETSTSPQWGWYVSTTPPDEYYT